MPKKLNLADLYKKKLLEKTKNLKKTKDKKRVEKVPKERLKEGSIKTIYTKLLSTEDVTKNGIELYEYKSKTRDQSWEPGREDYPSKGTLYDIRMGPIDKITKCKTCGKGFRKCPGHTGYIRLAEPFIREERLKEIVKLLNIFGSSPGNKTLKYREEDIKDVDDVNFKKRLKYIESLREISQKNKDDNNLYENENFYIDNHNDTYVIKKMAGKKQSKSTDPILTIENIKSILEDISTDDLALVYGIPKEAVSRPENAIMEVIPVPPPRVRMPGDYDHDLTKQFNLLLKDNLEAQKARNKKEREKEMKNVIKRYYDILKGDKKYSTTVFNLKAYFNEKGSGFHTFVSKRSDFGARAVISPDAYQSPSEVGVGLPIADKLTTGGVFMRSIAKINEISLGYLIAELNLLLYKSIDTKNIKEIAKSIYESENKKLSDFVKAFKNAKIDVDVLIKRGIITNRKYIDIDFDFLRQERYMSFDIDNMVEYFKKAIKTECNYTINKSKLKKAYNIIVDGKKKKSVSFRKFKLEIDEKKLRESIITGQDKPNKFLSKLLHKEYNKRTKELQLSINNFISMFEKTKVMGIERKPVMRVIYGRRYKEQNEIYKLDLNNVNIKDVYVDYDMKQRNEGKRETYYMIVIEYEKEKEKGKFYFGVGDRYRRSMMDGDYVTLTRQPVLHKQNIQGFKVKIYGNIHTIKVNTSLLKGFAGDCDGDKFLSSTADCQYSCYFTILDKQCKSN